MMLFDTNSFTVFLKIIFALLVPVKNANNFFICRIKHSSEKSIYPFLEVRGGNSNPKHGIVYSTGHIMH